MKNYPYLHTTRAYYDAAEVLSIPGNGVDAGTVGADRSLTRLLKPIVAVVGRGCGSYETTGEFGPVKPSGARDFPMVQYY